MEGLRFSVVATGPARGGMAVTEGKRQGGRRREQRAVGGGGVGRGRGCGPPPVFTSPFKACAPVDGPGPCGQGCILFSIFKI